MSMDSKFTSAWWLFSGLTADELGRKLGELDAHISDLEVENGPRRRFTAVLLKNDGKSHWWYYGLTGGDVGAKLTQHNAVPISLAAESTPNGARFAVSMQQRQNQAYWWYFGLTADELGSRLETNNARPVEIAPYNTAAGLRFAAIMVPRNSGAYWWWFGLTIEDVGARLRETRGQLEMIRAYQTARGTRFAIIVGKPSRSGPSWWYFGQTLDDVFRNARIDGTFVTDVTVYGSGSNRRFACVMKERRFQTSDVAAHREARRRLGASHNNGWHGFYIRRVGGPVVQAFNQTTVFDPCSSLKSLVHSHAMRKVQENVLINGARVTLETVVSAPSGTLACPFDEQNTNPDDVLPQTLRVAMQSMMQRSRNATTEAIRRHFGIANVNRTGSQIGMASTRYIGPIGCQTNDGTLEDFGRLFEQAGTGYLDADHWQAFRENALGMPIAEIVDIARDEAVSQGMNSSFIDRFQERMVCVHKGGNGANPTEGEKRSVVGFIGLPYCMTGRRVVQRSYVYGVFIDRAATIDHSLSFNHVAADLMAKEVRQAVRSFVRGSCVL